MENLFFLLVSTLNLSNLKLGKRGKVLASALIIALVLSCFVTLVNFESVEAFNPNPLEIEISPGTPKALYVGEPLFLTASYVMPFHNESYRGWDFWTTHDKLVPDYDESAFTFSWNATVNDGSCLLFGEGLEANFTFLELTDKPVGINFYVYEYGVFVATQAVTVAPASQPKTLQVAIINSLGVDSPKLSPNENIHLTANITALNQYGNESFPVRASDVVCSYLVTAQNDTVLKVNGAQDTYKAFESVKFAGCELDLSYASASEAEVWIHLEATCTNPKSFLYGQTKGYTLVVTDPFTSSGVYLDSLASTATYIIEDDDLGWYRVVSGTTGAVVGTPGTNSTLVTETILSSMTSGTLYMKEVAFSLASFNSIPENVQVVESVNDRTRTFINSADTLGSPYTVSVDDTYYLAQDRMGRFINSWSSTDCVTTANSALEQRGIINFASSNTPYILNNALKLTNNTTLDLTGATLYFADNVATTTDVCMIYTDPQYNHANLTIIGGYLNGNKDNQLGLGNTEIINLKNTTDFIIKDVYAINGKNDGFDFDNCSLGIVSNCVAKDCGDNGYHPSQYTYNMTFSNCKAIGCGLSEDGLLHGGGFINVESSIYITYDSCTTIGGSHGFRADGNEIKISNCDVVKPERYGIYVYDSSSAVVKVDNTIIIPTSTATYSKIYAKNSAYWTITDCTLYAGGTAKGIEAVDDYAMICGNVIYGDARSIALTSGADRVTITGNYLNSGSSYTIDLASATNSLVQDNNIKATGTNNVRNAGTGTVIKDNIGHVNANSGYSTGTGSEQAVAHGCDFTPTATQVYLYERTTGGALAYQSSAPNATHIFVTATNEKDYNWVVRQFP